VKLVLARAEDTQWTVTPGPLVSAQSRHCGRAFAGAGRVYPSGSNVTMVTTSEHKRMHGGTSPGGAAGFEAPLKLVGCLGCWVPPLKAAPPPQHQLCTHSISLGDAPKLLHGVCLPGTSVVPVRLSVACRPVDAGTDWSSAPCVDRSCTPPPRLLSERQSSASPESNAEHREPGLSRRGGPGGLRDHPPTAFLRSWS